MATIRVFVKFLKSIDAVDPDLHTKVQLPSLSANDDVRTELLDADHAEQVLEYLEKYQYASLRHVVMVLAWRTAMRRGAMHALDLDDYHREEQYLETVHRQETDTPLKNKESGERYVALSDELCELLDDWVADQRPNVTDEHGREPLLASKQGRVHHSTIQHIVYDTKIPFSTEARVNGLPRPWNFQVQKGYENITGLAAIGKELFDIPVKPLPDPLVPGNEPWHEPMNINGYEFVDTWEQYLDVLGGHGTIRRSEFNYFPLPENEQPAAPRPQCAAIIEVDPAIKGLEEQLFFISMIYATGRVECFMADEESVGQFRS